MHSKADPRMSSFLLLGWLLVTVCASAVPNDISIDLSATCGKTYSVGQEIEFRLFGTGQSPAADCSFTFEADSLATDSACPKPALCYMFDLYAHFTNPKASLSIESGSGIMTYDNSMFKKGPYCTDQATLKVTMSEAAGYVYNKKRPEDAYKFTLSVYHKCGEKGSVQNTKFEDAIDHAKGYHKSGDREDRERSQFVSGILLGFGLASIFLVVLLVAYCYTRNSPNRPPGRSVGMPKVGGFKKKMKPNQSSGPKEVEMGVRYQPQGDRDPEKLPESDPLITKGASDPEKPPVDSAAITVAVDEVDEKKPEPEPEQVDKDLEKMEKEIEKSETVEKAAEGDNSGGGHTNTGADHSGDTNTGADNSGADAGSSDPGPTAD